MQRHAEHKGEGETGCRLQSTKGWKFLSCLFMEGEAPFKILPVLKNCSVASFLTKSVIIQLCSFIEMYPFESIACVESSLLMVLVFVFQTLFIEIK